MALKRGHLILFALVAVFGLPFVTSWTLVLNPEWLPAGRAHHGQLIQPPVPTPVTGGWTLLVPRGAACDAGCQRARTVAQVVVRALGPRSQVHGPADCDAPEVRGACTAVVAAVGSNAALVIVDPMGNAMMRYNADVAPRDLLKDVQRLEKAASHWRLDGNR